MARVSFFDKRTLEAGHLYGGLRPVLDTPGRKLYRSTLNYLRRLESRGLVEAAPDVGENEFRLTRAGAEAIGVEWEEEA
jgi:hypothetical protein